MASDTDALHIPQKTFVIETGLNLSWIQPCPGDILCHVVHIMVFGAQFKKTFPQVFEEAR